MTGRRVLRRVTLVAVCLGALGLVPVASADASCVGPKVSVDGRAVDQQRLTSVVLRPGQSVTVKGTWFFTGCDDTVGSGPGSGCSSPPPEPVVTSKPARDVPLTLVQGGRSWPLGTADAAPQTQEYAIAWRWTVPDDVTAGAAELRAGWATFPLVIAG